PHPAEQPVFLTTGQGNPNAAAVRFVIDGAEPPSPDEYERLVLMFDGHDQDQVETAREHWKVLKASGAELTYWQQTPEGKWVKK
ncbi:MAG: DNA polymerase III subunit chi, partial [Rhizobiaceae bacterium]|nr:DNA polymerase III subunit chi [Rhizobiaceae bacterium]